jgi:hypothetical protein
MADASAVPAAPAKVRKFPCRAVLLLLIAALKGR